MIHIITPRATTKESNAKKYSRKAKKRGLEMEYSKYIYLT